MTSCSSLEDLYGVRRIGQCMAFQVSGLGSQHLLPLETFVLCLKTSLGSTINFSCPFTPVYEESDGQVWRGLKIKHVISAGLES